MNKLLLAGFAMLTLFSCAQKRTNNIYSNTLSLTTGANTYADTEYNTGSG